MPFSIVRLTKLTLSGFKSFARTTTFEFPAEVSAIVGPNGSGKSNVAEAIRWVLGEQSMKTLRGKRGEDLIFNGSANSPRMGKASVVLTFDNRDRSIPLDFSEVLLERKIFRDGMNEYYLQGSQVRLRDIVELLAKIGLGQTKHNIISQGEVDHILASSPRERRELLEEAIGLRIWQLKKSEAERKLEQTAENILQAGALIREISPHLKFLKSQADKAEKREAVRHELGDYERAYAIRERSSIQAEAERIAADISPKRERLKELERAIMRSRRDMESAEGQAGGEASHAELEAAIAALEAKRQGLERALGRIEGRMEKGPGTARGSGLTLAELERALRPIIADLKNGAGLGAVPELQSRIAAAAGRLDRLLDDLRRPRPAAGEADLAAEHGRTRAELAGVESELKGRHHNLARGAERIRLAHASLRQRFEELRAREEEAGSIRIILERLRFEEERLAARRHELERLVEESGQPPAAAGEDSLLAALPADELRRKIDRLRARLEEIGGIDPAILKEYEDTRARHDFLSREHADLVAAERDLKKLIAELEERIERDFKSGFAKVREAFGHYFRLIFGGGKGMLSYVQLRSAAAEGEKKSDEAEETEYGIEVDVDLPRKRIKGLAMLSGGERALVSAALLFAVTAVNPPPFLVLDETDAALDEANSQKYGAILKELAAKTQLILITHNRETMQQAGLLYGVTMGYDGVSKILSLKLEEAESYGNR